MADTYYQSQHEGTVIDEQITYVKDTVKSKIPNHESRIITIENDYASKNDVVKYSEKNQSNGYAGLNENCKVPSELLDGKLVLDGDKEKWDSHLEDMNAHEELLKSERETFNPLYANALIGTKEGSNITLDDANSGCPVYVTIYGKCTETLESPDAEKSPDNPATITGVGESGSVTVTVNTGADTQNIVIPLEQPLYGINIGSVSFFL